MKSIFKDNGNKKEPRLRYSEKRLSKGDISNTNIKDVPDQNEDVIRKGINEIEKGKTGNERNSSRNPKFENTKGIGMPGDKNRTGLIQDVMQFDKMRVKYQPQEDKDTKIARQNGDNFREAKDENLNYILILCDLMKNKQSKIGVIDRNYPFEKIINMINVYQENRTKLLLIKTNPINNYFQKIDNNYKIVNKICSEIKIEYRARSIEHKRESNLKDRYEEDKTKASNYKSIKATGSTHQESTYQDETSNDKSSVFIQTKKFLSNLVNSIEERIIKLLVEKLRLKDSNMIGLSEE